LLQAYFIQKHSNTTEEKTCNQAQPCRETPGIVLLFFEKQKATFQCWKI